MNSFHSRQVLRRQMTSHSPVHYVLLEELRTGPHHLGQCPCRRGYERSCLRTKVREEVSSWPRLWPEFSPWNYIIQLIAFYSTVLTQ